MSFHTIQDSLKRFKKECQLEEDNLLYGKCQMCIDGLLLLIPSPDVSPNKLDEISSNLKCSLALNGDDYILQLVRKCPCVKITFPPNKTFRGCIDLSLLESCIALEMVRIPFNQITGVEKLRQNLRSLVWTRGNDESIRMSSSLHIDRDGKESFKPIRIDEIFWDQFGVWPLLTHLCISRSNITLINASTIPNSIKTLDLRNNRICHFNNLANYSWTSTITKLCLEYNALKELPKLNSTTLSSLVYLSVRGNLLDSINGLRNFNSLDYLDLSENCIIDSKKFLSELVYLSSTLKTLLIQKNPICYDRFIRSKCESILYKLTIFNGKITKKRLKKYEQQTPVISRGFFVDQTLKLSRMDPSSSFVDDSSESQTNRMENIKKLKKSKPSKERIIVINDDIENPNDNLSIINTSKRLSENKNYFFGCYSGSYGSSHNNLSEFYNKPEENITISVKNCDEKKIEENLLSNFTSTPINDDNPLRNGVSDLKKSIKVERNQNDNNNNNDNNNTNSSNNELSTEQISEWASEDTEENTMFLVAIYSNSSEFEQSLSSNEDVDYYFVRIRPRDGLIFEKDCTSGKILQTLDLKILERYEYLNKNPKDLAIKLYFDTCIAYKKERIYRFLDEKSLNSFIEMFLSKYLEYRNQYDDTKVDLLNLNKIKLANDSNKFAVPWFYMCLRCGDKTHRIITDCAKCGSDLIIKDESLRSNNNNNIKNRNMIPSHQPSDYEPLPELTNDEETIDNDILTLDEKFFQSNIDHYLKLHIEIYLYERIGDMSLKSESVEALFHCSVFDFIKQTFTPGLAVLTANYFFLFDHLISFSVDKNNKEDVSKKNPLYVSLNKENEKKDIVSLIFYSPLARTSSTESSPLIISHLPKPIKNIGYWIEFKLSYSQKKILANLKNKKKQFILELILFADEIMGKAFLELLFKFQKVCIRTLNNSEANENNNLIMVKSSITKLMDGDDDGNQLKLEFDEICQSMLNGLELNQCDECPQNRMYKIFTLGSFQFLQNINSNITDSFNNLFTINENIALIIVNDYLIIGEIYCSFTQVCSSLKSFHNEPIANLLKEYKNFNDQIEVKTLFKEWIINLMPNLYIDKSKFLLVMRFREDDDDTSTIDRHSLKNQRFFCKGRTPTNQSIPQSTNNNDNLIIYEFKLQFLSLHSLIKACQMICSSWENNFGVSLTLSKYRDEI